MAAPTFAQRQRRAARDHINAASRAARGLTVYPATGPTLIVHTPQDWVTSSRKRDRAARPGGKLPAGTAPSVRRAARLRRAG